MSQTDQMITSPTSLVASTLVSMKTPPRLLPASPVPLTAAPAMPSMIMITNITETSSSGLTQSLGVIEVEKKFVAEMIDSFYKGLRRCISLVLKGSISLFEFLKVVVT